MWDSKKIGLRQVLIGFLQQQNSCESVTTVHPCPSAPLQEVWPGGVWQMFLQAFHHPADGLRVRGARVRQLPRVHHWRRVGNSRSSLLPAALSVINRPPFCLSRPVELPRRPSTTASTALFTCTTRPRLETCSPLAPTRSSRSERRINAWNAFAGARCEQ